LFRVSFFPGEGIGVPLFIVVGLEWKRRAIRIFFVTLAVGGKERKNIAAREP
jgi:hypothetical protein